MKEKKTQIKREAGFIQVIVPREDRLEAITNLSEAILAVAHALNQAPSISISDCYFGNCGTGMTIETEEELMRTEIQRHSDD